MLHRSILALILISGLLAACTAPIASPTPSDAGDPSRATPAAAQPGVRPDATPAPMDQGNPPPPVMSPTEPAARATRPTPLVVDDRKTANPALVESELRIPPGLRFSAQMISLPPGFAMSVLAVGLTRPRFMAFDAAGNLLVADQTGRVYRYPAAAGAIAPAPSAPAPLLSGLDGPSSLAFAGGYLYVGETGQISRYHYQTQGALGPAEVVVPRLPSGGA